MGVFVIEERQIVREELAVTNGEEAQLADRIKAQYRLDVRRCNGREKLRHPLSSNFLAVYDRGCSAEVLLGFSGPLEDAARVLGKMKKSKRGIPAHIPLESYDSLVIIENPLPTTVELATGVAQAA